MKTGSNKSMYQEQSIKLYKFYKVKNKCLITTGILKNWKIEDNINTISSREDWLPTLIISVFTFIDR